MFTAVTGVVLMRGLQWKPNRGDEVAQQADRDHRMNGAFGFCDSQILCLWTGRQAWKGDLEEHGQTLASSHLTGRWNQYGTLKKKSKVGSLALWAYRSPGF